MSICSEKIDFIDKKKVKKTLILFITGILLACSALSFANSNGSSQLIEYLTQEKNSLTLAIGEVKTLPPPGNQDEYQKRLQENNATIALNKAKITSLESFLINQKKLQADFSQRLKQLQQFPSSQLPQISSQEKIEKINTLNDINKKTIDLINENLKLARRYQEILQVQKDQLELWKSKEQMNDQLTNLHAQEDKLNDSLQKLFQNSLKLQQDIKSSSNFKATYGLEARLLLNNQVINLTQHKIAELNLQGKLARADFLLLKSPDIRTLQTVTEIYKNMISQLSEMEQSLKKMVVMLKNELPHLNDSNLKQQFNSLLRVVNARIAGISIQEETLQEDLENHQQELKKQLAVRQSLSEYRIDSWPEIFKQLAHIPTQFYNYCKSLAFKARDNYLWQDTFPAALLWMGVCVILVSALALGRVLKRNNDKERSRLSGHLYDGVLNLFEKNLPHLTASAILFVLLYGNYVPFSNYQMLFNLLLVWLTFRTLILIARRSLLERISDSSGKDVRLYYRFKWLLMAGGWTTALMVFSHQLPLAILIQDIFNRLFMLFLLAVSLVIWKSKDFISHLLHPLLKSKKRYLRHAIVLLEVLIPFTVFTTASLGLIGYINLAWTMSIYQVQILMIITGYVLLRGLMFDALELLSEWMISSLRNGWLWIEVILKPIDRILRIMLLMTSLYVLFQLFDWHSDSLIISKFYQWGEYPIVNLSGIRITAISVLEFLLLFSICAWISKWTREFCYRWLYRDARDAGIRNSLSVFTQYAVILVGGFISLRVLGLDFSGMSMVIGGLAVGMGFGLRDFASNIVGGLMLLIERPVREGDLITLGGYEGKVAHIGIRSMRVSSWDNMEVLIPNAETFNKPFTNWTHQDSIIRTVVPVKVSRADDPCLVQALIMEVLATIPEIVPDPPCQVFLKQIDEALIEFEVRYFINVEFNTRVEIRSKVLFAIMAKFKEAGIKPPIPPITVELKEKATDYEPFVMQKRVKQRERVTDSL
ncbi:mechanosensitive ion channel domain-containing protein [Legionella quinlivanii]|uniref:mechanosensitive ion channel domain-containing protein n=1 Tax=Legionella quinlivanii TaxID=45073 RepID=UPI00209C0E5E|nr:mechanosensitive ion channel domain-containing protein [Legionella quinlivanii]